MAILVPELVLPGSDSCVGGPDGTCENHRRDLVLLAGEGPKVVPLKESLQKEKQIMVDPISLRGSSARESSFNLMLPPPAVSPLKDPAVPPPPILLPAKPKFLSCSLPNSTTSSPRFSSILSEKKWRNESQASPRQIDNLTHLHPHLGLVQDTTLQRSKSCGEGEACRPSDEFDLWLRKPNASVDIEYDNQHQRHGGFSKAEANKDHSKSSKSIDLQEDGGFKCGALCLYLPGFGKGKPERARKAETVIENVISRTVSLEKFECGSWASSAIAQDEDGDSMNLYFDLPLELIRSTVNEANSPVSAAFVFDKDVKGVLKNGSKGTGRKSTESPRHVRFSTSSPTSYPASPASCITPRLRKAREDFNAFLEAQSA